MEYKDLIPEKEPEGLIEYLINHEYKFKRGVLTFKKISRREEEPYPGSQDIKNPARLWCSECTQELLAEYISEKSCNGSGVGSGVHITDGWFQNDGYFENYSYLKCPMCGSNVQLRDMKSMRCGYTEQVFCCVPTVKGKCLVITQYCIERHIEKHSGVFNIIPWEAAVLDGKKLIRLVHVERGLYNGYSLLTGWKQRKRFADNFGDPIMYGMQNLNLDGTPWENAKLREYFDQSYNDGFFFPIAYLRLYNHHRNVENLIMAGIGLQVGQAIDKYSSVANGYYGKMSYITPNIKSIAWKKAKPTEMLHMTKQQFQTAKSDSWNFEKCEFWMENHDKLKFNDFAVSAKQCDLYEIKEILKSELPLIKTANYIKKQKANVRVLMDYLSMAKRCGLDLTDDAIKWPPHLQQAHDRLAVSLKYREHAELLEAFDRMTKRCQGLCWEHDGICIRPAKSEIELIEEGRILKHCVGGYGDKHAAGEIILFIRHTRRPERSWFTLNVDVYTKRIIQNHGYGNEYAHGKHLTIPKRVNDFVDMWKREVLDNWELPAAEKKKSTRKNKKAAKEA